MICLNVGKQYNWPLSYNVRLQSERRMYYLSKSQTNIREEYTHENIPLFCTSKDSHNTVCILLSKQRQDWIIILRYVYFQLWCSLKGYLFYNTLIQDKSNKKHFSNQCFGSCMVPSWPTTWSGIITTLVQPTLPICVRSWPRYCPQTSPMPYST